MDRLMRFLARCVTGAGFVALGADALVLAESFRRTPYTLAWLGKHTAIADDAPVLAAATESGTFLGGLPISLVLLWVGAMLFVMAAPER
ncbi:MAG: hypothetical protein KDE57_00430 [Calditrichaeota bacterium]|nr:hypothetical protein [Calditrichota bacterium]